MAQYYMLNKPRGLLTARRDARCETVMRCFPEALQQTLHPVGRLDKDTEGLLLFTDDGMLDVLLLRPERHVEKEYEYRAFGHLDEAALRHGPRCSRTPPSGRAKRTCRSGSGRNI